jgi:hypothetical protein
VGASSLPGWVTNRVIVCGHRTSRRDSLIEFVKRNVAILPLLILTATTGSDELSYGLNDTAVHGSWIGSNWESTGEAPLADTLASIMDPLHTTEQLHALKKQG